MSINTWELPWREEMVPHAVIDLLRPCNISCRACYNTQPDAPPKSVAQIERELDQLLAFRRLSSVSVLGGEVTLHPELCDVIMAIRARDLHVELVTNGLEVDEAMCHRLKEAGVTAIYFHIEKGQTRADLPAGYDLADVNRLRVEKARIAARAGLDPGLTVTSYPDEREAVRDAVALVLKTPEINYLLVTLYRDSSGVKSLTGNLFDGFEGEGTSPAQETKQTNRDVVAWMLDEFGLQPFGSMASNLDENDPRWLSYLVGTVYDREGGHHCASVTPSLLEKTAVVCSRLLKGRYPMYQGQDPEKFRKQLRLNGLLGGQRVSNKELLRRSWAPDARLTAKRILFQNPAELTDDGRLIHCRWCPDAVLKNGALVPVCIADRIS